MAIESNQSPPSAQSDLASLRIDRGKSAGKPGTRRRRRRFPWGLFLLLLFIGAGVAWWFWPKPPEVRLGSVALTYPSQSLTALTASGYIVADRKSAVASKITSSLVWLGVEEGQHVTKGEILARLESDDLAAAHAAARAEVAAAKAALGELEAEAIDASRNERRLRKLVGSLAVAQSEYDVAETRLSRARAAIRLAQKRILAAQANANRTRVELSYATLRAPFDAVVLTKNADVGDIITPVGAAANARAAAVTIADLDSLQAEVDVSESQISKVANGQPCEIELDALPGERFPGSVHMIVPTADRTKATILVKVRFSSLDPRVLPDMSTRVSFLSRSLESGEEAPRLTVPAEAIITRGGRDFVLKHLNGVVAQIPIIPGGPLGGLVEVTGDLKPGERVILSPDPTLAGGMPVRVLEE